MTHPQVRRVLDISTAHIRPQTSVMLSDEIEQSLGVSPVIAESLTFGWLVYVPEGPDHGFIPKELRDCFTLARSLDCDWVRLDPDGAIVDGLPIYDW